jgi:hypothetical protein
MRENLTSRFKPQEVSSFFVGSATELKNGLEFAVSGDHSGREILSAASDPEKTIGADEGLYTEHSLKIHCLSEFALSQ